MIRTLLDSSHRKRAPIVVAIGALLSCGAACHHADAQTAETLPEVRAAKAEQATLHDRLPITGVLDPLPGNDVKVGALVSGRLVRVRVAEGDKVKVGQVLAELESTALADQVRHAEAEAHKAKASSDVARSRADRDQFLFSKGAASQQQSDESRAGAVAAQASISDAQANLSAARLQLERATLRSPIEGLVAAVFAHGGEPQDGTGKPVVEVADPTVLELRAAVPALRAAKLHRGDIVSLRVEGGVTASGAVFALAPLVDPATGAVTVRVRVDNRAQAVRGGSVARGEVVLGDFQGAVLPARALVPGGDAGADAVVVLDAGDVAHPRSVTVLLRDGDKVGVDGIAAGDRVVVEGAYGLADGTKVKVVQ